MSIKVTGTQHDYEAKLRVLCQLDRENTHHMAISHCLRELSIQVVPEDAWHADGDDDHVKVEVLKQGNSRRLINIIVLYIRNTIKLLTCNTRNLHTIIIRTILSTIYGCFKHKDVFLTKMIIINLIPSSFFPMHIYNILSLLLLKVY